MKIEIQRGMSLIRGRFRLMNGFCPMCNSDAPELYDCPICDYYSSASGDKFPIPKSIKVKWWCEYSVVIDARAMVHHMVKDSRMNKP